MALVIASRYRWFNKSQYDTYFNNTLLLMLVAQLLREHAIEQLLERHSVMTTTTAQHLSLAAVFISGGEFMGFITLWSKISLEETRRRQRYHRAAALILAIAFVVVTTRARDNGQLLEVSGGWDNILAWGLYAVVPVAVAIQIFRMCIKELRRTDATQRERRLVKFAMLIALAIGSTTLTAMFLELFEELGWVRSLDYRLWAHAFIFFWEAVGTTVVASIPVVRAAIALLGLDVISRRWRQLETLRRDMNTAVPGTAFEIKQKLPGRRKGVLQLHQTTVQIRDALLQLRPYFTDPTPEQTASFIDSNAVPASQRTEATLAFLLARAARAKAAGEDPREPDPSLVVKSRSTNLAEETSELIALSKWWPHAKTATEPYALAVSTSQKKASPTS